MTVVGLILNEDKSRDLVVFDPSFYPTPEMIRMRRTKLLASPTNLTNLILPYLRGAKYLAKYDEFELLT